ncbi:MAG TPA: hypothetical protein VGZ47_03445, partial [Gemmataceae bacterium]|nr:hypothetical protein [Gemmataceae bacterium]
VLAQQPPGQGRGAGGGAGFGGGFGANLMAMISLNKPLQDELKMDQDQVDKVTAAISKVREDLREEIAKARNATPEDRAAIVKKFIEANTKAVSAVLKPEQIKRFTQIENQQAGFGIFTKEDAAAVLKLSAEQKEKITAISEGVQKDIRELTAGNAGNRGGFNPEMVTKRQTLQKEAMEKAQTVLNDEQKKTFKDLVGEPFQMQLGFGPGRGQGGFPGAGGGFPGAGGGFGGFARLQPGQILPVPIQASLNLTDEQKKEVEALQKEVDAKLEKILTEEQRKQLKDMQQGAPRRGGAGRPAPGGNPPPRQ